MPNLIRRVYDRQHPQGPKAVAMRVAPDGTVVYHSRDACHRKGSYADERSAWFALRQMRRQGDETRDRCTYQCQWCGNWHIGRKVGPK